MPPLDRPILFLATANDDTDAARDFYTGVLGFRLTDDSPFALVFDAHGSELRIQKLQQHQPAQYTSLGWSIDDISATIADLTSRGVTFARYPHLDQDDQGVWTTPSGAKVAWFTDPAGNTLSLTQTD